MRSYIGLIQKAAGGNFGVTFPDFPGVFGTGTTLDSARSSAQEALTLHIASLAENGAAIPPPSTLEDVMSDPDNRSRVAILMCIKTEQARAIRVNVTMPEDVLTQLDRYAEAHGFTRSRLLTQAAKRLLAGVA
ncbi:MAG TPA: type II toxin-antitoxin system HicB family antitoxin [Bradyrhizobium sp.]|jgi:predicted RNase H-like HicB family nuclease|nr:type II toxin-antitoxin system HicB family antitoxin [Bradyrhizobium sp.]